MAKKRKPTNSAWTRYLDQHGEIVEVSRGLGEWWIVGRTKHLTTLGSTKRVKSPTLPPRKTPQECQADLDRYAERRKWKVYQED